MKAFFVSAGVIVTLIVAAVVAAWVLGARTG